MPPFTTEERHKVIVGNLLRLAAPAGIDKYKPLVGSQKKADHGSLKTKDTVVKSVADIVGQRFGIHPIDNFGTLH